MKDLMNIAVLFIIIAFYFFSAGTAYTDIIKKEPYSVKSSTKYKENLNIAFLPLSGELSEERKYVKELIKNYISDKIFAYKKIRFANASIDFKTYGFDSSGKKSNTSNSIRNNSYDDRFLILKPSDEKQIEAAIKTISRSSGLAAVPGTDIIITGNLIQNKNNIKANIKVLNHIYAKEFIIEREGTFKNIDQLLDELSYEIIKSIIVHYSLLAISCNEKDAGIYIDGRYFGRTDRSDIILETGIHEVEISKEKAASKKLQINIAENSFEKLHIDLIPETVQTKSVKIITIPDKARVYQDSGFIGLSPVVKSDLEYGIYRIRIEKEGYITKYITLDTANFKDKNNEISVTLEKGDSIEFYSSRTSAYNILFKCSFFGMAVSTASYIYFGSKVSDESAKLNALSPSDPNYSKIEKRKDRFALYRQISLFTLGAMIISTGIFYYLDISQDDIAVALYMPQNNYSKNSISIVNSSLYYQIDKSIGIAVTKSF